eukprot:Plantae.Rhodophyta-Rhodochaete_pulchella.ctg1816.p1 GENE.Plantae.Rhodophyta-Rhodochaete_pulchella.ctg1816~~Plantae.Rhodophyta-Rhodochaete_pulchella.ctg1816.p1  ORF type:complete len:539 (+),score=69.41 Plantae.Rhodophyta-Rhodochaete_pulchella.ctg1816:99-1619(+)
MVGVAAAASARYGIPSCRGIPSDQIDGGAGNSGEQKADLRPLYNAPSGFVVPPSWINGVHAERARRVEEGANIKNLFTASSKTNLAGWASVYRDFLFYNPSAESTGCPEDGPGFLRGGKLQWWAQHRRDQWVSGTLLPDRKRVLLDHGLIIGPYGGDLMLSTAARTRMEREAENRDEHVEIPVEAATPRKYNVPACWLQDRTWTRWVELCREYCGTGTPQLGATPAESFEVWCHIWTQFVGANLTAEDPFAVPQDGYGFLSKGYLNQWAVAQTEAAANGTLSADQVGMLRSFGFPLDDRGMDSVVEFDIEPECADVARRRVSRANLASMAALKSAPRAASKDQVNLHESVAPLVVINQPRERPWWMGSGRNGAADSSPPQERVVYQAHGRKYMLPTTWSSEPLREAAQLCEATETDQMESEDRDNPAKALFSTDEDLNWLLWFDILRQFYLENMWMGDNVALIPEDGPGFLAHGHLRSWALRSSWMNSSGRLNEHQRQLYQSLFPT